MKTKKINFIFFTLFLTLLNFHTTSSNIVTSTAIKTGMSLSDHAFVENLKVGDEVLSCKLTTLDDEKSCVEFIKIPIKEIIKIKLKKLVFIETNVGQLCVGENKKFYNSKNNNWVDAKNLTTNDEFLDINFNNIYIEKISIQSLDEEIDSYELLLEEPHTFFICDSRGNPILVHNWVIAIPVLTWTFGEGVTIIGLSTAAVVVGKQILNGIVKHFAKENGADVSGFNPPSIFQEDIDKENEEKDRDKNPDKDADPSPDNPPKLPEEIDFSNPNARRHTFDPNKPLGHYGEDTKKNADEIFGIVKDENFKERDRYGNDWYGGTVSDGKQVWVKTRNGKVTDAGKNQEPREITPGLGYCNPHTKK